MTGNVIDISSIRKAPVLEDDEQEYQEGIEMHCHNIIDIRWFSMERIGVRFTDPIGVVLVEDSIGNHTFAIMGTGKDPQEIVSWGTHLNRQQAEGMFGYEMHDYKVR